MKSADFRKQQRRRSYRFPAYQASTGFGRQHQTLTRIPLESEEDEQNLAQQSHHRASEDVGAGRMSFDYGSASAVLSFSLSRGETLYDILPSGRHGGTTLRPVSVKPSRATATSLGYSHHAQVDVIALIHELEARELPSGDHPDKARPGSHQQQQQQQQHTQLYGVTDSDRP